MLELINCIATSEKYLPVNFAVMLPIIFITVNEESNHITIEGEYLSGVYDAEKNLSKCFIYGHERGKKIGRGLFDDIYEEGELYEIEIDTDKKIDEEKVAIGRYRFHATLDKNEVCVKKYKE